MDKQTLSNYGWLVIVTLILAVMIAFATPFGNYVGKSAENVANAIIATNDNAVDENNLKSDGNVWETKFEHNLTGNTKVLYFDTIEKAVDAINTDDYSLATGNKHDPILIIKENGAPIIKLQDSVKLANYIKINKDCKIDLNDYTIDVNNYSITFNDGVKSDIKDGVITKTQTTTDSSISTNRAIVVNNDVVLNMLNINGYVHNDVYSSAIFLYVSPSTNNQFITIKNCNIQSTGNLNQLNSETNEIKAMYNIYALKTNANIKIHNSNLTFNGLASYNIYCLGGTLEIDGGSVSTTENWDTNNWSSYSVLSRDGQITTINNVNITLTSNVKSSNSAVTNSNANVIIKNSTITASANKTLESTSFMYAVQTSGSTAVTDIENCNLTVNASNVQPSALRCQGGGTINCRDSSLIVNFNLDCKPINREFVGYVIFMNGVGENTVKAENCFLKGEICVAGINTSNTYTENNNRYEAVTKIYNQYY